MLRGLLPRRSFGAVLVVLLVAGLVGPVAPTASAQYPIVAPGDCADTFGPDDERKTIFPRGGRLRVAGEPGCARPNEPNVRGVLQPGSRLLFRTDARADGSYVSGLATLPTRPGSYRVVVRTQDNTYVQPIKIVFSSLHDSLQQLRQQLQQLRQRLERLRQRLSRQLGRFAPTASFGAQRLDPGPRPAPARPGPQQLDLGPRPAPAPARAGASRPGPAFAVTFPVSPFSP